MSLIIAPDWARASWLFFVPVPPLEISMRVTARVKIVLLARWGGQWPALSPVGRMPTSLVTPRVSRK